jgi:hypothetical protein
MTDATCLRCGTSDRSVRTRPGPELPVALCGRCYATLTSGPLDPTAGFTRAWAFLVTGLLVLAAAAAMIIVTR